MRRNGSNLLRLGSIGFLLLALVLFFIQMVSYSRERAKMPEALTIADVPVGRLSATEALERLMQVYTNPIELYYNDEIIYLQPASVGFRLDTEVMLAAAELQRSGTDFWSGFWDYLWGRPGDPFSIPLRAEYSSAQLEAVLIDIAARYDIPPIPAQPIPGTPNFDAGVPGTVLDISRAEILIDAVLQSPANRQVILPVIADVAPTPSLLTLETLMRQNIEVAGFDGLAVVFMQDLQTGDELHFSIYRGQDMNLEPDIAFAAASTIKISIMTAFYRYFDDPLDDESARWMYEMITQSGNDPSDWLMQQIDEERGPLLVTETMRELGLQSTFTAGYYYLGAPLLRIYETPANLRQDINTRPDIYTQTTASEIGTLLSDIYSCANNGGGALVSVFPEEITTYECQEMLDLLSDNQIGVLLEAGVPDGTRVAHKHGWRSSPLDMVGDAGIIFTPGGDYVLTVYLWNSVEMVWEPTSALVANLSRAVYNYFNPPLR
ncbi:MAG: serine hydrolase [Anaerolineales bacterium]|nr:serine hydrolase [Anaerolineales bacterium]